MWDTLENYFAQSFRNIPMDLLILFDKWKEETVFS